MCLSSNLQTLSSQKVPIVQATRAAKAVLKHHKPPGKIVVPEPSVAEVIGVRGTKVDPKESVARLHQQFAELGALMAAGAIKKREQDDG